MKAPQPLPSSVLAVSSCWLWLVYENFSLPSFVYLNEALIRLCRRFSPLGSQGFKVSGFNLVQFYLYSDIRFWKYSQNFHKTL